MTLDELANAWNAQADPFNQWEELGLDEMVAFAQQQALLDAAEEFEGAGEIKWSGYSLGGALRLMAREHGNRTQEGQQCAR